MNIGRSSQLLNEHEAAELLSLSVRTLQQWRVNGRGPAFLKLMAAVRYSRSDLEAFIASGRRAPSTTISEHR